MKRLVKYQNGNQLTDQSSQLYFNVDTTGDTCRLDSTLLGLRVSRKHDSVTVSVHCNKSGVPAVWSNNCSQWKSQSFCYIWMFLKSQGNWLTLHPVCGCVCLGGWCTRSRTTEVLITSWRSGITTTSPTGAARTTPWAPCAESASTKHQDRLWSTSCQQDTHMKTVSFTHTHLF